MSKRYQKTGQDFFYPIPYIYKYGNKINEQIMFVILGTGPKEKIEAEGKFVCPNCNVLN